ncbi:hypothetical protein [Pelagicoccus mobilis]|uniref:hypothetical protein n=1 Tax=Pelagicoccus mobilis TaxID=415221 RepID=UPI001906A82E|nr:hypothetical protein [Pelagicoccus mobilis]
MIFEPEFYHEWDGGESAFEAIAYLRKDSADEERDLFDLREFSYLWVNRDWELRVGISKVFWGVAESQHLVDTINQTDLVANPDGEDKLGQPMVQAVYVSDHGDFSLFVLPGFRERTFPGEEGRLRGRYWVDTDNPIYESSGEDERVDFALRWKHYIGDYDVGVHYFRGTNRDPGFVPGFDSEGNVVLRPYYELMDQVGLDLQLTRGGWLWKLEAIARESEVDRYSAMVGGFEYTLYGLGGSVMDLGLLAEAHLDSRGENAPVAFNRDLFVGGRLTWNDEADTNLVAGTFWDAENGSTFARVEFERRLGSRHKLEVEVQKLMNIDGFDPLYPIRRDSFLQVALSRYF